MSESSKGKKRRQKSSDSAWELSYSFFKPQKERLRETLCALGNGYFGTRGAACEASACRIHYPGTYIAGVYNKLGTRIAGKIVKNEDFVNCPNWLPLTFKIEGSDWLNPAYAAKIHRWYQSLNFKTGILKKIVTFSTKKKKKTTIIEERLVHMADRHRAAISYKIKPENYSGKITVRAGLDGSVENDGVDRYRQLNSNHLEAVLTNSFGAGCLYLKARTSQSKINLFEAARVNIYGQSGKKIKPAGERVVKENKKIYREIEFNLNKKETCRVEKIVALYTSKDKGIKKPSECTKNSVLKAPSFKKLAQTQKIAWQSLWERFDIKLKKDDFSQKVLRLHAFHLLQTASLNTVDLDVGLPARGLHGEAYRGHIFWDEIFATPFYDAHLPKITQSSILYRYRRLLPARRAAKKSGYRGAMFPWQSSLTGEEETQTMHLNPMSGKWGPDYSHLQRHVSFAIVYNIWRHWERTSDLNFMRRYGTELIVSIAQLGASLAKFEKKDNRYHTEGLMGPDEFHEKMPGAKKAGFRDNAYTNILIVWTLLKAQRALEVIPEKEAWRIRKKLRITEKDLKRWEDITRKMNLVIDARGVIGQFEGYFKLKELDWDYYRKKYQNIERMDRILKAEGKSPDDYKVIKQADVLMIFYLIPFSEAEDIFKKLGYKMNWEIVKRNYNYYIKRTSHGSTLSKVVHCYLSDILAKKKESWRWFLRVLESDIYDTQGGTTPEGIHAGVMGGSIDIVTRGFCGVRTFENRIKITPNLPENLTEISYNFHYQGCRIFITLGKSFFRIQAKGKKTKSFFIPVEALNKTYKLFLNKPRKIFY